MMSDNTSVMFCWNCSHQIRVSAVKSVANYSDNGSIRLLRKEESNFSAVSLLNVSCMNTNVLSGLFPRLWQETEDLNKTLINKNKQLRDYQESSGFQYECNGPTALWSHETRSVCLHTYQWHRSGHPLTGNISPKVSHSSSEQHTASSNQLSSESRNRNRPKQKRAQWNSEQRAPAAVQLERRPTINRNVWVCPSSRFSMQIQPAEPLWFGYL